MPARSETFFDTEGGVRQFFRLWLPGQPPCAAVVLIHGLGDHSGCFARLAEDFTAAGLAVFACDLYGNGQTEGLRGDAPSYDLLLNEAEALLRRARQRFPGVPLVLYGHSMGGGLVLNLLLRRRPQVACAVVTAPWLRMARRPGARAVFARLAAFAAPRHRFDSGLDPAGLSHDADFAAQYTGDPLVHGFVSARLFAQASAAGVWALRHAKRMPVPVLLVHGGADPITSCAASGAFAARSGGMAQFHEMPDNLHTLHNETDGAALFTLARGFFARHLPAQPASRAKG